jgi:hypothetical protein
MEKIETFKTIDGRYFESENDALSHEDKFKQNQLYLRKEKYIRERLRESVYKELYLEGRFQRAKIESVHADNPPVFILLQNPDLVRDILNHLETMK